MTAGLPGVFGFLLCWVVVAVVVTDWAAMLVGKLLGVTCGPPLVELLAAADG